MKTGKRASVETMGTGPDPINRREALQLALAGGAGLAFAGQGWSVSAHGAPQTTQPAGKAKSVIQIWMWGGPSHLDTFDPKPEAGPDYCGPLDKPIPTNVDGIQIGQLLPELAKQADKYSIIRSMTHDVRRHETASYMVQTGRKPGDGQVYPCAGAVVSHFKGRRAGYQGLIPPYIVLTKPQGRFSEAGFLGASAKPFATGGDPSQSEFVVEGVVSQGITEQQQKDRRDFLHNINTLSQVMSGDPVIAESLECKKAAYELLLGDAGKVFDLSEEKDELRSRYGRSKFGQSCLVARRLVEQGVPYVTINYEGWDSHKGHFQTMRRKLPELDRGMATLLQDLADRGLLDTTIVWWGGEFGRGPKIQWKPPWNGGRSHFASVFSHVVAGGGFQGGQVVGASNATGEKVKERPVYPADLIGSIYHLLGIDGKAKLPHPRGLDVSVLASGESAGGSGGILTEIMS